MTREQVEAEIRRVLATETSAVRLSNMLFTPGGLFGKLYSTPDEKRTLLDSPVFDEANRRLSEPQRQEAARLTKANLPVMLPTVGAAQIEQVFPAEAKS